MTTILLNTVAIAPIDFALILGLMWGMWRGYVKGLMLSLASLAGLIGGIWAAAQCSHLVAESLDPYVSWSKNTLHSASLAITFLAVLVGMYFLGKFLERILNFVALGLLNKVAGAVFGGAKVAFIMSGGIVFLNHAYGHRQWVPDGQAHGALIGPLESLAPAVAPSLRDWRTQVDLDKLNEDVKELERQVRENAVQPEAEGAP